MTKLIDKKTLSWALYDWANSAFATTVLAFFFPIFFNQYWSQGLEPSQSTFVLGVSNSLAALVLAIASPLLGAYSDQSSSKKKLLGFFTFVGITCSVCLYWVQKGDWFSAIALFAIGNIGFFAANAVYDSLLPEVTETKNFNWVSSLGYGLGYLGGGLLFALNVFMTLKPETFGLADKAEAVKMSFVSVGVWWALFSIPVFLVVKERPASKKKFSEYWAEGLRQIKVSIVELKAQKNILIFLIAYFLYIDGVATFIKMAVDYAMKLGFSTDVLIKAGLMIQFIGFPAALGFGVLAKKLGAKRSILCAIGGYFGITIYAYFMQSESQFYWTAACVGLIQGGIQALSRSLFGQMIPQEKAGEFFGFFNMLGKFSSVIGPVLMGATALLTGDPRLSVLSLLLLFGSGAYFLLKVREP